MNCGALSACRGGRLWRASLRDPGIATSELVAAPQSSMIPARQFFCVALLLATTARAAINFVSVVGESQDPQGSHVAQAGVWTAWVPPYPLATDSGVGRLIDRTNLATDLQRQTFTLHSHLYEQPFVPVPFAMVTYGFDVPTAVGGLEVVQHMNGISQIEGFTGDAPEAMRSIGLAFSQRGDVSGGSAFDEGEHSVFNFTNAPPARFFRFAIRKTRLADGYGIYRAYPRKPNGWLIEPVERAAPVPPLLPAGMFWLLGISAACLLVLLAIVLLLWLGRRRGS